MQLSPYMGRGAHTSSSDFCSSVVAFEFSILYYDIVSNHFSRLGHGEMVEEDPGFPTNRY